MTIEESVNEKDIAKAAALVLQNCFIEVARTKTVLYVKDDIVWSKSPNSAPVLVKKLSGRNPELAKRFAARGTYKFKKRNVDSIDK
ncbi:hypothetical protein MJ004_10730 [Acinetobacter junii]|uniref:hypothetical protein n=1 Tax=Acinetobacter junii TaxID=40215 RepID=UPI0022EB885E|nr:hypothetical protein [Acinetobacter junii]MDA3508737.1 hypothetical protein [Acinetobacter junii]MDA3533179.1 hypothetical protein [Acinetobacter junii]